MGGNTGANGTLYLDGDLLQKYIKHTHGRTEQEVYTWMTTSEMGQVPSYPRERGSSVFLAPVITSYIRGLQDTGTGGKGTHGE